MAEPRKQELVDRLKGMGLDQLKAGLATRVNQVSQQTYAYLKFDGRSGVMNVNDGDKDSRFPDGVELAFNLLGSSQGYVCWKGGEVVGQHSQSFFEPIVPISSMEDHGPYEDDEKDGWQEQHQLFFKDLKTNTQYILRLVSKSGIRQVNNFIRTIHEQSAVHDFTQQTPIVTITPAQSVAKGNKNYKPVFTIKSWIDNPKVVENKSPVTAQIAATAAPKGKETNVKLDAAAIEDTRD